MVPVPGRYGRTPISPAPPRPNNDGAASEMQLLPQDAPGLAFFFEP